MSPPGRPPALTGATRTQALALYRSGLSIREVAAVTGTSYGAVYTAVSRAGLCRGHGTASPRSTDRRWRWVAVLAPLEVATGDGRMLASTGQFDMYPHATFLLRPSDDPYPQRGSVRTLTNTGTSLVATGVVYDPVTRDLMAAGKVWPEITLIHPTNTRTPSGVLLFTRGTVGAVLAGDHPAWPDSRFILEES